MPKQRKREIQDNGSVYQRKNGSRWVGSFIVEGTGKRKVIYADTEKEAWGKLQQIQLEQKPGKLATGKNQNLEDYLELWLEHVEKPGIREGSYVCYRGLLNNYILPALGHIQIQELTGQQIQEFYAEKAKEGQSALSINSMQRILHKALDNAVHWKIVSRNVSDDIIVSLHREDCK